MQTLFPDPETRAYAQRCAGYLLVGDNWLQTFIMLKGRGGNGKSSVYMAGVLKVMGEMAAVVPETTFIDGNKSGDGPTPIEAQWPGKRVYFADEIAKGKRLNAAMINALTGGLERTSHGKGKDPFTWRPVGTPVICVNKMPPLGDDSNAMLRRAQIIPFSVNLKDVPEDQRMTEGEVKAAIEEEAPGILNWMLEGLRDIVAQGFAPPRQAQEQLDALRADADPVTEFLHACVMRMGGGRIPNKSLATTFANWAEAAGVRDMAPSALSKAMADRDFLAIRSNGKTWVQIDWVDARTVLERGFAETDDEAREYVQQVGSWRDDLGKDGLPR
jgi:putative DNA primase/helicase